MATQHTTTDFARRPAGQRGPRPGVTLIELLVVITIMLIITAAAIPTFAPSMANRRVREAARQTSSFISGARARAIETGRPVGVQIEAADGVPGASLLLTYVETPPPYCGETTSATMNFQAIVTGNPGDPPAWPLSMFEGGNSINPHPIMSIAKAGDLFQLNYQGHILRILKNDGVKWYLSCETISDPDPVVAAAKLDAFVHGVHPPLPYQLFRQPVRSSAAPLQLPESMVIDVNASGYGGNVLGTVPPYSTSNVERVVTPLVIIFAPTGSVNSVSVGGGAPFRPTSPIFLLVGQRAKLPPNPYSTTDALTAAKLHNFRDPQNLWVSINPSSGLVTTSQVFVVNNSSGDFAADVATSRSLARDAQTLGGN